MNYLIANNVDYLLKKCEEYDVCSKKDHLPFMQQKFDRFSKELLCLANMELRSSSKDKSIEKILQIILHNLNNNLDTVDINKFEEENLTLDWIS